MFFQRSEIKLWQGKYNRIIGKEYVFHVYGMSVVIGRKRLGQYNLMKEFYVLESRELANAVNEGKRFLNPRHDTGGSFIINEFGKVIVPSSVIGDYRRVVVGRIVGNMTLGSYEDEPPFRPFTTDISSVDGLILGSKWENRPYVGVPYVLSNNNKIYFRYIKDNYEYKEYLNKDYYELVSNLRLLRSQGPLRFIVNPYGIVLTKVEKNNVWTPVFVQKLDYDFWFDEED